jgi:taurine transport system permease protein
MTPALGIRGESRRKKRGNLFYFGISAASVLVVFIIWYVGTKSGWINTVFLPAPAQIWRTFLSLLKDGYKNHSLLAHVLLSMKRLFIALGAAVCIAAPLGLAAGRFRIVRAVIDPFVEFYRPLPPLAYYTLIILWFGIKDFSKILLLFLGAFAPLLIGVIFSAEKIPEQRLNGARSLGASGMQLFTRVILPSCLPDILTSLRTAVGVAYATLVAAEMVAAVSGIGWMVLDASKFLRNDIVYAGIFVMGIIAILMDAGLRVLIKKVTPWLAQ